MLFERRNVGKAVDREDTIKRGEYVAGQMAGTCNIGAFTIK